MKNIKTTFKWIVLIYLLVFGFNITKRVGENNISFKKYGSGFPIYKKYDIEFYDNENVRYGYLNGNHTLTVGVNDVSFGKKNKISFYDNENVRYGYLNDNHTLTVGVNDVSFGKKNKISFYDNGNVEEGYLNGSHTIRIGGNRFKFWKRISFYENGNVKQGRLKGRTYNNGQYIRFNVDGTVNGSDNYFKIDF